MVQYCFSERPRELYIEAFTRGFVAAARQYPHVLSWDESLVLAQALPGTFRGEVCCIPADDYPYQHLVIHGWTYGYWEVCHDSTISEIAQLGLSLKPVSQDEALAMVRESLRYDDVQEVTDKVYARFQRVVTFPA